jgi:ABC-2 type transport system permease protein
VLRGLWTLTWIEIKIFVREPLGVVGSVAIPVLTFIVLGRLLAGRTPTTSPQVRGFVSLDVPVLAAILICLSAVLSLVTIIAIYREGGILKRLRATPLRPHTILTAHVLVKLLFTTVTMAVLVLAGKRYYPAGIHAPIVPVTLALLASTISILSMGFLIASLVPTARFAQPIGTLLLYPMLGLSGLFVPIAALPPSLQTLSRILPLTYATSLLEGMWKGDPWAAHTGDLAGLAIVFCVCTALSAKLFRWE